MATVDSMRIVATAPSGASAPDSITQGGGSIWVEYGNGASDTGLSGSSTIVQYSLSGTIEHSYSIAGLADGLKVDPYTGNVWALMNNNGNSNLTLINPATQQVSAPLTYAPPYVYGANSTRGYDDVVFAGKKVFVSLSNPVNPGDPVIQELTNGTAPFGTLTTSTILSLGDTGRNLLTGQINQPLPVTDPDSLKMLPTGQLMLTSEADHALTFVSHPGMANQSVSFLTLPVGATPDDAIMPTATAGTFYVTNEGANDVVAIKVSDLNTHDLYVNIYSLNELAQIDPATGKITVLASGLNNPHGLLFIPAGATPAQSFADRSAPGLGAFNPADAALLSRAGRATAPHAETHPHGGLSLLIARTIAEEVHAALFAHA